MSLEAETARRMLARIMAHELADVVEELRAIDLIDLVCFVRLGSHPALEDLLQSSTELLFEDGSFVFGWTAEADVRWSELPSLTLGMEFRHRTMSVFFDLWIRADCHDVVIAGLQFETVEPDLEDQPAHLAAALLDARRSKRVGAGLSSSGR